jgi:hypothetical protein
VSTVSAAAAAGSIVLPATRGRSSARSIGGR